MADTNPNCCATKLQLLTKILEEFQSRVVGPIPQNLLPVPTDDSADLWRKILATFALL